MEGNWAMKELTWVYIFLKLSTRLCGYYSTGYERLALIWCQTSIYQTITTMKKQDYLYKGKSAVNVEQGSNAFGMQFSHFLPHYSLSLFVSFVKICFGQSNRTIPSLLLHNEKKKITLLMDSEMHFRKQNINLEKFNIIIYTFWEAEYDRRMLAFFRNKQMREQSRIK